jgi:hypothetical protein
VDGSAGDRERINRRVSSAAGRFLYGRDKRTVEEWTRVPHASSPLEPGQLGFITGRTAVAHEFTSRGWAPMPFFPTNLPEFPPSLRREGPSVVAELYDPTSHFAAAGIP